MASNYSYTETEHLEHQSLFHNFRFDNNLLDDKNLLEAIRLWEEAADDKYVDILGYACSRLAKTINPKAWAEIEVNNIDKLLATGSCELLSEYYVCGYYDLDLEQIPKAYKALLIHDGINFISNSLEATKKYLDSEQDDSLIDSYFPRTWVVASQVQALIWYKEFLVDVVKNGISFRVNAFEGKQRCIKKGQVQSSKPDNKSRLAYILNVCKELKINPLNVPCGKKGSIVAECLMNKEMFKNKSAFKHAWEYGNNCGAIRVEKYEDYLNNQ
jgi:hypothetical protein